MELLAQVGIVPAEVTATDVDEAPGRQELPAALCQRLASAKAGHVAKNFPGDFYTHFEKSCPPICVTRMG